MFNRPNKIPAKEKAEYNKDRETAYEKSGAILNYSGNAVRMDYILSITYDQIILRDHQGGFLYYLGRIYGFYNRNDRQQYIYKRIH